MGKIEEKLLAEFKKANETRKEKLAKKYGFESADLYLEHLERVIKIEPIAKEVSKKYMEVLEKKVRPVIHNVTLSDATVSMAGSKYNNSKKGILRELSEFNSTEEYEVRHHVYEFIDTMRGIVEYKGKFCDPVGHNTPLWWAVTEIIRTFIGIPKNEKVLVKVYTDGVNNEKHSYLDICKQLIQKVQSENFTVTFVGTEYDLDKIIRNLELDKSNTLEISNDGEGFEKAFDTSLGATKSYAEKVVTGEDVSIEFYKNIK